MLAETYREKLDPNKPVGTIDLGSYVLVIYPRTEGGYFFRPFKPDRSDVLDKTRNLAPNTISAFTGLDPDLLEMIEIGAVMAPQVTWRASSGVLDEPQIEVTGQEAFGFSRVRATFIDNEVVDLFTKPVGNKGFKAASFVYLNTALGDIMGVVVRRNSPVVLLITPAIEGSRASSKDGLNNFLSGILSGLTSKMTPFEAQVLNALADASANEYFQLPYDGATLGGKLQNNLLMQIYTAKTFFLARDAEINGKGMNDAELLEFFPYLKVVDRKNGLATLFAGATNKSMKIEPSLWDELVEDASKGISLKNPQDKTPRPKNVTPLLHRGIRINAPQVMSAAEIAAMKARQTAPVEPVKVAQVVNLEAKSREESVRLAGSAITKLNESLGMFAVSRPEKLTSEELAETVSRLHKVAIELKKMTTAKKKIRPPVVPTPINLIANKDCLKMFGVLAGQKILDFLVPMTGQEYVNTIERSTQKWIDDSNYQDTAIRSDPGVRSAATLLSSNRLVSLAEHLKTALNLRDVRMINQGIDLVYMTFYILVEKTVYLLSQVGEQLCQHGQEAEINNWAHYSNAVIERLISIAEQIQ